MTAPTPEPEEWSQGMRDLFARWWAGRDYAMRNSPQVTRDRCFASYQAGYVEGRRAALEEREGDLTRLQNRLSDVQDHAEQQYQRVVEEREGLRREIPRLLGLYDDVDLVVNPGTDEETIVAAAINFPTIALALLAAREAKEVRDRA